LGCSKQPVDVLVPIAIHKGWTDSSQEDLRELREKYLRNGLWKAVVVSVRREVAPAERDGKTLRVDDTPREASS